MELAAAQAAFHTLLDSLSEEDFKRQSLNPGWTNGEILAHMTFGFSIVDASLPLTRLWGRLPRGSSRGFARLLNWLTGPFNRFNALGARMQARAFTYARAGGIFDKSYGALVRRLDSIREEEWSRGMYYPTKWDPNFGDYMTIERLFRYPVLHFRYHFEQIAGSEVPHDE